MAKEVIQKVKVINEDLSQNAKWAREVTLEKIFEQGEQANIYMKLLATKFSPDELKIAEKNTKDNKKRDTDTKNYHKELTSDLNKGFSKLDTSLLQSFKSFRSELSNVGFLGIFSSRLNGVSSDLAKFGGALVPIAEGLGVFTGLIGVLYETFTITAELNSEFQRLYESGVNINGGLAGLASTARDLGISTSELASSFTNFSGSVVALGTDRTTKLAKQFNELNRQSGELGITNEDSTAALLEYTDMLRVTSSLSGRSNDQLVKGAQNYYTELNEITNLTGKNRKELQKEIEDRRKSLTLNLAIARLAPEVQAKIKDSLTDLSTLGPTSSKLVEDGLASIFANKGPVAGIADANERLMIGTNAKLQNLLVLAAQESAQTGHINASTLSGITDSFKTASLATQSQLLGSGAAAEQASLSYTQANMENEALAQAQKALVSQAHTIFLTQKGHETEKEIYNRLLLKKSSDNAAAARKTQDELDAATNSLRDSFDQLIVTSIVPALPRLRALAEAAIYVAKVLGDVALDIKSAYSGISSVLAYLGIIKPDTKVDNQAGAKSNADTSKVNNSGINWVKDIVEALSIYLGGKYLIGKLITLTKGINSLVGHVFDVGKSLLSLPKLFGSGISNLRMPGSDIKMPFSSSKLNMASGGSKFAESIEEASEREASNLANTEKSAAGILSKSGSAISGALRGFGSLFSEAVVGVTDTLGKASVGLSELIKNLGSGLGTGVGKLFEGLMKGLAGGFKAFANPEILVGATILAGTVTVLGTVSWAVMSLVAKGLQQLGYGLSYLKMADKVNGENLVNIGKGISEFVGFTSVLTLDKIALGLQQLGYGLSYLKLGNKVDGKNLLDLGNAISLLHTNSTDSKNLSELGIAINSLNLIKFNPDKIESVNKPILGLDSNLNLAVASLKSISTEYSNAVGILNSSKINQTMIDSITDISKLLYTDTGAGLFTAGKVTTASKIRELAQSVGELSTKTAELNNPSTAVSKGGAKLLSPSDLQKKTLDFYTDQKQSNASLIQLLQMVNVKLDALNDTTDNGSDDIVDAIKKISGRVY